MLDDIRYRRAIKRVDLRDVLSHLGIQFQELGDELKFVCPSLEHKDSVPSCTINFNPNSEKFTWFSCFGCGYSGRVIKLISDIEEVNLEEAKKIIVEFDSGTDSFKKKKRFKFTRIRSRRRVLIKLPEFFQPIDLSNENRYLRYLRNRGVLDKHIIEYEWGYCTNGNWRKRVVLPVYINGQLVNCFGRHISPDVSKKKKHKNSRLSNIERIVFPYDKIDFNKKYIWVTESAFNYFKLIRLGLENVICLFGNKLTDWKVKLLSKFFEVRLVPDGDSGGDELVRKCILKLNGKSKILTVDMLRNEDVGSIKLKETRQVLSTLHAARLSKRRIRTDYSIEK